MLGLRPRVVLQCYVWINSRIRVSEQGVAISTLPFSKYYFKAGQYTCVWCLTPQSVNIHECWVSFNFSFLHHIRSICTYALISFIPPTYFAVGSVVTRGTCTVIHVHVIIARSPMSAWCAATLIDVYKQIRPRSRRINIFHAYKKMWCKYLCLS